MEYDVQISRLVYLLPTFIICYVVNHGSPNFTIAHYIASLTVLLECREEIRIKKYEIYLTLFVILFLTPKDLEIKGFRIPMTDTFSLLNSLNPDIMMRMVFSYKVYFYSNWRIFLR